MARPGCVLTEVVHRQGQPASLEATGGPHGHQPSVQDRRVATGSAGTRRCEPPTRRVRSWKLSASRHVCHEPSANGSPSLSDKQRPARFPATESRGSEPRCRRNWCHPQNRASAETCRVSTRVRSGVPRENAGRVSGKTFWRRRGLSECPRKTSPVDYANLRFACLPPARSSHLRPQFPAAHIVK